MDKFSETLKKFCLQAATNNLQRGQYPKSWGNFELRISFGMGQPARIPWIAFLSPEMKVTKGIYPVYLYYKELGVLVLAYGVSETEESPESWSTEITDSTRRIEDYLGHPVPRYGDSRVFRTYKVLPEGEGVKFIDPEAKKELDESEIDKNLEDILEIYGRIVSKAPIDPSLFYMEEQLEDFLIKNWDKTELSKQYELIVEDGELVSQQYPTDIGKIDILIRDKKTKQFVVIELKKNQTSDDTVGQISRYMGWVQKHKSKGALVKGIIIAARHDKRLGYALSVVSNIEVYLYQVDFKLKKPSGI